MNPFKTFIGGRIFEVSFEEDLVAPDWADDFAVSSWFMKTLSRLDPNIFPHTEGYGQGDPTFDSNRFAEESRRANDMAHRLYHAQFKKKIDES